MSYPSLPATLLLCAGALATGLLLGWLRHRLRLAAFVPLAAHREELMALRRRYRRRLRALRDTAVRHRLGEKELRDELRAAADERAERERLLAAAESKLATLQGQVATLEAEVTAGEQRIAAAREREMAVVAELRRALERVAAFERDHGLMRIERDELAARTARLRALPPPEAPDRNERHATPQAVTPRAELADRDARIHELECQLAESESRTAELETSLRTWKYRIAPLAMHLKRRRENAQAPSAEAPPAPAGNDDLKRMHGIGRSLEKKLRTEGVTTFAQLAAMSPAELANLAVRVGVAASRPQRHRWAEQAQALAAGGAPASGPDEDHAQSA